MKVITYLGFTLLSIFIQFCVMDFIQERLQRHELSLDVNSSVYKKHFGEILKDFQNKPHALFFQVNEKLKEKNENTSNSVQPFVNTTITPALLSPNTASTPLLIDVFYDENTSTTDIDMTTENIITTTEFENYTEINLFDNKNKTLEKPKKEPPKVDISKNCECNLLYKTCDINCCCDGDCSEFQIQKFSNCYFENQNKKIKLSLPFCSDSVDSDRKKVSIWAENLFCIAKSNAPEKRNINDKMYTSSTLNETFETVYKWENRLRLKGYELSLKINKEYEFGDFIFLLKNGSVETIDIPTPAINDYCNSKIKIKFLQQENVKCLVKIRDLEMFNILRLAFDTNIFSVSDTFNSSILNCSTVHCANWTVLVCREHNCSNYNKSLHEPMCTNKFCTGIALGVKYEFYYCDAKIIKAVVKLYTQTVSIDVPYLMQETSVDFYFSNRSIDNIIKLSGNLGYLENFPLLVSQAESNHTELFYKTDNVHDRYLILPTNKNGLCNENIKQVMFGENTRKNCKIILSPKLLENGTNTCKNLQRKILNTLRLDSKIYVSPLGNPHNLKDSDWILLNNEIEMDAIHGFIDIVHSKVHCTNFVSRISFVFMFADVARVDNKVENKVLHAKVTGTACNATFDTEDINTILTIDINFIDITKPSMYKYVGSPNLHFHLPTDFFFPFPLNCGYGFTNALLLTVINVAVLVIIK